MDNESDFRCSTVNLRSVVCTEETSFLTKNYEGCTVHFDAKYTPASYVGEERIFMHAPLAEQILLQSYAVFLDVKNADGSLENRPSAHEGNWCQALVTRPQLRRQDCSISSNVAFDVLITKSIR